MKADGSGLTTVSDQAQLGAPSWSPDGQRVVYGDALTRPSRERGGIFTAATNTTVPTTARVFPSDAAPLEVRDVLTGKLVQAVDGADQPLEPAASSRSRGATWSSPRRTALRSGRSTSPVGSGSRRGRSRWRARPAGSRSRGAWASTGRTAGSCSSTSRRAARATLAHVPRAGEAAVAGPADRGQPGHLGRAVRLRQPRARDPAALRPSSPSASLIFPSDASSAGATPFFASATDCAMSSTNAL